MRLTYNCCVGYCRVPPRIFIRLLMHAYHAFILVESVFLAPSIQGNHPGQGSGLDLTIRSQALKPKLLFQKDTDL